MRALVAAFPVEAYYVSLEAALEALAQGTQFNVIELETGWKVDLIVRKRRPFSQAEFERRTGAAIEGVSVSIATAEDVMISKLEWARLSESNRQIDDVAALLRVRGPDLDFAYLERWVASLDLRPEWEAARDRSAAAG